MRTLLTVPRAALAAALTGLLALAAVQAPASSGEQQATASQTPRMEVLGGSYRSLRAACPRDCEAVGRVTGFQVTSGGTRNLYRAPRDGRIAAWSIKLARPSGAQQRFFNDFYGGTPRAAIAVMRPGSNNRWTITGQSPVEPLDDYLGSEPMFVLDRPLTVRRGYVVALVVPTWAPAFATGRGNSTSWRASRPASRCADVQRRSTHSGRGETATYGCTYRTARLLYRAFYVRR